MFENNDFSEQPKIHTVGVLPMRRPAEYYQEQKPNDPAVQARLPEGSGTAKLY